MATSSRSTTASATTDLPDVDSLPLDASTEDELTATPSTSPSLNHGEFVVEYKDAEASTWTTWGTLPDDYASGATITGLIDGEKYDVRARSQTVDVTGAWLSASDITLLPAPADFAATATAPNEVEGAWTDTTDHIGSYILRRRDDAETAWTAVATVDDTAEVAVDDTPYPEQTYDYQVRAQSQYVYADSGVDSATTPATGRPQTRTRRSQWHVEIVLATGEVLRPSVSGTPQIQPGDPQGDIMPRLDIPVPARPRWTNSDALLDDGATVRAWYDGAQLPIDEVVSVDPEPGQVTLRCRGASQLDRYIESLQIDSQETHLAMRELVDSETDYGRDIDDPDASTRTDVTMLSRSATDLDRFADGLADGIPSTAPLIEDSLNNEVRLAAAGAFVEAEGADFTGTRIIDNNQDFSGDEYVRLSEGADNVRASWQNQYDVPADSLDIRFLISTPNDNPAFQIKVNGSTVESYAAGTLATSDSIADLRWFSQATETPELSSGSNPSVTLEITSANGNNINVDAVFIGDARYSGSRTFDSDPDSQAVLDGPEPMPPSYRLETIDVSSVAQVVAGSMTVDTDDTSNDQRVGVSNDQGASWLRAKNSASVSGEFASASQQIRGEAVLSRYGEQDQSPRYGYRGQAVASYEVRADLDDTPVLLDKQYSGPVGSVLSEMADSGDFVLQARRDSAAAWDDPTGVVIEGTVAGQRTRDRVPDQVVDYSAATTVEGSYDRIIVKGVSRSVEGEAFTAATADDLQGLAEAWIIPASETVVDPSDGTEFDRGDDYRVDWREGAIEITSEGEMSSGTTYEIDYEWRVRGAASTPGVSNPSTQETIIPDATSQQECEQLALAILKRVQDPLREAEVTVATSDPTVSLIAAFAYGELPFDADEDLVLRGGLTVEPGRVTQRLGTRQSVGDVIEEIQSQFRSVAERV